VRTLRKHNEYLSSGRLRLRPLTEDDWDILLRWNNDPEVLYYSEGDDITSWALKDMQKMYRGVSRKAFVFIAELKAQPIGECWLQEMNLDRILQRYSGLNLRRIDLMIGEKQLWGKGWGTIIIGLLTRFGFEKCQTDVIFGCSIAHNNPRSRRAFEKNGYTVGQEIASPDSPKGKIEYDMILSRQT